MRWWRDFGSGEGSDAFAQHVDGFTMGEAELREHRGGSLRNKAIQKLKKLSKRGSSK